MKKQPATRADLQAAEGRLDEKIDDVRDTLAAAIVETNERMTRMEDRLGALIRQESGKGAARIDAFLNKLIAYDRETVRFPRILDAQAATLRDHESRLLSLENRPPRGG